MKLHNVYLSSTSIVASALTLVVLLGLPPTAAAAQSASSSAETAGQEKTKPRRKVKRSQTMRPVVYKKLEAIQKLADEKNYASADKKLAAIQKMKRNSYEQAMTWNMVAYISFNQQQVDKAIKAYNEITKINNIPESLAQTSYYSLAKLYLMQEQYQPSLAALNSWFAIVEKPSSEAHILRAQIYYQLEQFAKALPEVKKAQRLAKAQGKKPRENWLLLERAVYFQNQDYRAMERCLKDLLAYYPKPQYWVQLAAVYNELQKPGKELAALESAYDQEMLTTEAQLVSFSQALLAAEIPYKSAQVLLLGMKEGVIDASAKNLSLLGDALMIAKEYEQALDVMGKAAEQSQQGRDFFKLAQIYSQRQQYALAFKAVQKTIALNDVDKPKELLTLKGLILFNLDRLPEAKQQFSRLQSLSGSEATAKQWLAYIDSEQTRRAYMQGR